MTKIAHCIECGCLDFAACHDPASDGPCGWLVVDRVAGVGVCSACPQALPRWNAGDRTANYVVRSDLLGFLGASAAGTHFLLRTPRVDLPFEPDDMGEWEHPDFRWALIPDEGDARQSFQDAGFELRSLERDLSNDEFERGCLGWTPPSLGGGWFLVLVLDTEDGPQAIYARNTQAVTEHQQDPSAAADSGPSHQPTANE